MDTGDVTTDNENVKGEGEPNTMSTTLNSENCSTNTSDSGSEDDSSGSESESEEEDVAKWGKTLLRYTKKLNKNIESMSVKQNEMSSKLTKYETDHAHTAKVNTKLGLRIKQLELENIDLREMHIDIKEKLLDLEFHQRRNNLVFDGIPEVINESDYDCFQKIIYLIRTLPGIISENVKIDRCHRLGASGGGRAHSIIACLNWYGDMTTILRNRSKLPRGVFVSEDLPIEWVDSRRVLRPLFMKLKEMDEYKHSTFLTKDKLIVKGQTYSAGPVSNLSKLNDLFDLSSTCEQRSTSTIAFHGIHSVFSNFHPAPYRYNNILFPTVEHSFQYGKADLFDDDVTKSRILKTNSPYQAKKLGSRVKNYVRKTWHDNAEQIAYNAV